MHTHSIDGLIKLFDGRNLEKLYIIRDSRVQSHCAVKPSETLSVNILLPKDNQINTTHAYQKTKQKSTQPNACEPKW